MRRHALLTVKAEAQVAKAYDWYASQDRLHANRWYRGLIVLLRRLPKIANRAPLAPENDAFPVKVQQVLYGTGRKKSHRIVFVVRPEAVVV